VNYEFSCLLSQCKFDCEEDNTCIGFSRDKIDDEKSGNCYPKTTIGDCHTLRKGDPPQRNYAQKFDSYLKSNQNINNLYNRCIGDAKLTLNKKIYLGLYSKPDNYISILNKAIVCNRTSQNSVIIFIQLLISSPSKNILHIIL
jgi:hypothetical protein